MADRFQHVNDIAALCAARNVNHAVICPGSRSAPLVLAFSRHPGIQCKTVSDERSAAFIALGMAQQTKVPTVLICTSGSAAYNFAPAVAEAFFSKTPLLIITADRPSEWVGQQDGQTIYQHELYGQHVKQSFVLSQAFDHADNEWANNRMVNEAISLSLQEPCGPVHINAPFREPLYPTEPVGTTVYTESVREIREHVSYATLTEDQKESIRTQWSQYRHVLLVSGQQHPDEARLQAVTNLLQFHNLPVVSDVLSNLHAIRGSVKHGDLFLGSAGEEVKRTLQPDLLITFGESIVSKNIKLFLREYQPKAHWHIQPAGAVADTFKTVSEIFRVNPNTFFNFIASIPLLNDFENQKQINYTKLWEVEERRAERVIAEPSGIKDLGEMEVVREVIMALPSECNLHLANSMSVRYANFIGLAENQRGVHVYCNRGTSGIDGCNSTAVGHSLIDRKPNVLITGDLAFFYDRNAFWHNYDVPNLRVVLLNNHGGIIFRMIDGPATLPESGEFFVTDQRLTAVKLSEEFKFEYVKIDSRRKLRNLLKDLLANTDRTTVLEFESPQEVNISVFEELKTKMRKSYEL